MLVAAAAATDVPSVRPRPILSSLYQMFNSRPVNGQCTNFILFGAALQLSVLIKGLMK